MARCWELRDCDGELLENCAHPNEFMDRCPTKCAFARCDRPQHVPTFDSALIFDDAVDHSHAIKEECLHCEFFILKGPRKGEGPRGPMVD